MCELVVIPSIAEWYSSVWMFGLSIYEFKVWAQGPFIYLFWGACEHPINYPFNIKFLLALVENLLIVHVWVFFWPLLGSINLCVYYFANM